MEVSTYDPFESGDLRCPRCFAKDIVVSLRAGIIDDVMRKFGRTPQQCRCCGKRFYVRETDPRSAADSE